ncbi:MAG: HD domain-containing phosphohydrolase [Candidatus Bipolaricaulota bacterium]
MKEEKSPKAKISFEKLAETSPAAITTLDKEGNITYANSRAEMTLHHHERLDGSGYPHGLEGDELTKEVRILGAVDVVEAMSTRRPYREARTKERTLDVIKEGKGTKFDPEVVDILVDMIEEGVIQFGRK